MRELTIDSIVPFGAYTWRVLDIKDNMALIITENIIEQQSYNNYAGDVTWAECSLRKYLNGEFLNRFTEADRERIVPVWNKNQDNQWYASRGGEDTYDYIFLLSIEEAVCKYFGDSSIFLNNRRPKQLYWFQFKDENNARRTASLEGYTWWWWLRSPGRDKRRAVYIHSDGNIGIQGNGTYRYNSKNIHPTGNNCGGVRPALWLRLDM